MKKIINHTQNGIKFLIIVLAITIGVQLFLTHLNHEKLNQLWSNLTRTSLQFLGCYIIYVGIKELNQNQDANHRIYWVSACIAALLMVGLNKFGWNYNCSANVPDFYVWILMHLGQITLGISILFNFMNAKYGMIFSFACLTFITMFYATEKIDFIFFAKWLCFASVIGLTLRLIFFYNWENLVQKKEKSETENL